MMAVLKDNLLLKSNRTEHQFERISWDINGQWTVSRLFNLAKKFQLDQLWIAPESDFYRKIKCANDTGNYPQFWNVKSWTVRPARLKAEKITGNDSNFLTGWDDSGFRCQIHFPGMNGVNWPLDELAGGYELINALIEFRDRVGIRPSFPHRTAFELLRNHARKPEFIPDNPGEYWDPFRDAAAEWIRLFPPRIAAGRFAHAFDKRAMFLTAARSVMVGTGPYTEIGKCDFADLRKVAGLVEVQPLKLKHPILKELFAGETRILTPLAEFLEEYNAGPIKVKRGWIWDRPVRYFEKFSKVLGDAIKATRASDFPEVQAVNGSLKQMYVKLIGWFNRGNVPKGPGDWNADLYRPDWRALIIATANANLLRNVFEVEKKRGLRPFGIYHDCLMYFADFKDPADCFGSARVMDRSVFSHEWTRPADAVFADIADGRGVQELDRNGKAESIAAAIKKTSIAGA